jgi:hypothetical protein
VAASACSAGTGVEDAREADQFGVELSQVLGSAGFVVEHVLVKDLATASAAGVVARSPQ